jgi:hypothetical protein
MEIENYVCTSFVGSGGKEGKPDAMVRCVVFDIEANNGR